MSGIGKGIIASSTGLLLKTMGLKVTAIKIDPYLNIGKPDCALNASAGCSLSSLDAGTMKPTEHGEVFVLDDGGEVDLDLGIIKSRTDETHILICLARELRALSADLSGKGKQHNYREDLPVRHCARATRRLPGSHSPGGTPYHRCYPRLDPTCGFGSSGWQ